MSSEVFTVIVQIAAPTDFFPGQVAEGRYTFAKGVVTLTDYNGVPVRDGDGKTYSRKVNKGEDARVIVGRMTKEFRGVLRKAHRRVAGFDGPIDYPPLTII